MFVLINEVAYEIDTAAQEQLARDALRDAGESYACVWHGDPDDSSAYVDRVHKLFASNEVAS